MDLLKKIKLAGLCAGVAVMTFAAGTANAQLFADTDNVTVDVTAPTATVNITTPPHFGDWTVIQSALGTPAYLILLPGGTIDTVNSVYGTPGNARFLGAAGGGGDVSELEFDVTAAVADTDVTFQIGAPTDPTNLATPGFGTVAVTVDHPTTPLSNGTFTLDNWACNIGTATENEAMNGFNGATGVGTLTLGDTTGAANVVCGGRLTTVASANSYGTAAYTGSVRVGITY